MPYIDINIDVDEFLESCSRRDIKELIQTLVDTDHLPKEVLTKKGEVKEKMLRRGRGEEDFSEKLESLKTKYYSLSEEEENLLKSIFKKYI
jgi:hypothetical protein